jgi:hypothetical protein
MLESGQRAANTEHAALVDEAYDYDETEDVIIDWS